MTGRPDLFGLFTSTAPAPVVAPIDQTQIVHWIHITPSRARTGCGIYISSYERSTRLAATDAGEQLSCSIDVYSDSVTCQACKDAI